MKFKVKGPRRKEVRAITVESGKNDAVDYADIQRLVHGRPVSFVPFEYQQHGRTWCFMYDPSNLVRIDDVLAMGLEPGQLSSFLISFLDLLGDCERCELKRQRVALDHTQLFFDVEARRLRFVYVPLQSLTIGTVGISDAMAYLCERADTVNESVLRTAALEYARGTAVVTSGQYRLFLVEHGALPADREEPQSYDWLDTDQLGQRSSHGLDFTKAAGQSPDLRQGIRPDMGMPAARPWILIREATGASWQLGEGVYDIGRDESCSIVIPDARGLSRMHACFTCRGAACAVTDMDSTNGVFVDGRRIMPRAEVPLRRGSALKLGAEQFTIR